MTGRRRRIRIVIDTNVFVGNFLTRSRRSPNRRVIRLWLVERSIKLVVSDEIRNEYRRIFEHILGFEEERLRRWEQRFNNKRMTETVTPGTLSITIRDPKDSVFISVASASKAKFVITNDRDLLEISETDKRKLKFRIVTPGRFLEEWEARE